MSTPQQRHTPASLKYAVDIVMCIDVTLSMTPVLANVARSALEFPARLAEEMTKKGRSISSLRLKVIAFRDFGDEPKDALMVSPFFRAPDQLRQFQQTVRGLRADGGGDEPESGLEALAMALASDWETGLDRRRHVIVMFTDASAHQLGDPGQMRAHTYPRSIPQSLDDLFDQWGYGTAEPNTLMENSAKRLLMFTPDVYPWNEIASDWNNSLMFPSEAGEGLEEWEMDQIIATIANSL
jgi:hypothetical protein